MQINGKRMMTERGLYDHGFDVVNIWRVTVMSAMSGSKVGGVVWSFRILAVGSVIGVGIALYPIVDDATIPSALQLASSEEELLAVSGLRRIGRSAKRSATRRARFVEEGAVGIVRKAVMREDGRVRRAGLATLEALVENDDAVCKVLEDSEMVERLIALPTDETAGVWKVARRSAWALERIEQMGIYDRLVSAQSHSSREEITEGGVAGDREQREMVIDWQRSGRDKAG